MKYFIIIVISFFAINLFGQSRGEQLKNLLKNKRTMRDIMATVDSFYNLQPRDIIDNGGDGLIKLKHWKKWEWEQSKYLGPNGEFVNAKQLIFDADEIERRNNKGNNRSQLPGSWNNIGINDALYSPDSVDIPGGDYTNSYANGIGRVDRIAFHPTDPNTYYVGAPYGGLWKTTNNGSTWKCLTDTIPSIGIAGIVVDWNNPNNIYILTGTADNAVGTFVQQFEYIAPSMGVMKSTDAGLTWNFVGTFPLTPGVTAYTSYALTQNPIYAAEMLAATSDGVFRTLNSGVTWTKVRNGKHFDVMYKPNDPDIAYCTTNDTIAYSIDYGGTWTVSSTNINIPSSNSRIALCGTNAKASNVYAICSGSTAAGQFNGVYKSTNNGILFTRIAATPNILNADVNGTDSGDGGEYMIGIAVSHLDTTKVNTCALNTWGSSNGGSTFTIRGHWIETTPNVDYVHADHHHIMYNKLNNRLYSCNDGGVWYSNDNGTTWVDISKGLVTSQFYHLEQYKNSTYILSGGQQDNGIKFRGSGTENYVHLHGADGFTTDFQCNNPNIIYTTWNSAGYKFDVITGLRLPFNMPGNGFYKRVMADNTDSNKVYIGASNSFYSSNDKGLTWTTNNTVSGYLAMHQSQSTPATMYIAGGANYNGPGSIWRTTNGGTNWTNLTTNPGFPTGYSRITDIETDPNNSQIVYVTFGGFTAGQKVFLSVNGGDSWVNISYNLPNIVAHCIKVDGKVYVGTDLGIYRRDFNTSTWVLIRDNMPKTPITDIHVDQNTGSIICSTFGRGVWQRNFCVNNITLTGDLKGRLDYSASNVISASTLTPGMNNVDSIFLNANGKLLLTPGFHAKTGTYMKTSQLPCDNGSQPFQGEVPQSDGVLSGRKDE